MKSEAPRYLAIEGAIGVGKTSLARRLADAFGTEPVLERPEENPFLERFYQARARFALPTQLFFLFQRARQIQALKQSDMFRPGYVADFMLEKDTLFARANLADDELRLYEQVYAQLRLDLPVPDQVIYLQAPVDVLMERIRKRDLGYERLIDRAYLQDVVDAYTQFFYHYTAGPLLVVNAAEINFVDNDKDFTVLVEHIRKHCSGRHFFNPLAT
ncbi:MAG: deoxynucleoside kinase [Gammaproteobacteria bacterium]|nr:deoxynucleoside kinase [Gammaproteobacteria bacterium]